MKTKQDKGDNLEAKMFLVKKIKKLRHYSARARPDPSCPGGALSNIINIDRANSTKIVRPTVSQEIGPIYKH